METTNYLIEGASNEDFFDTYFDYLLEGGKDSFADFLETFLTYDIWDNQ